ncbi:hypothetical protein TNCV_2691741 [Trichonephila clavipes]|uniref:Uncharacterized protein n=1 Tax=Trichonephila clavipes TaxID=2585209 RepID=A0A8X6VYN0_TRICX|nr:hypothetical protein TNCV_2691741 [Trichonephila clavipes]
MDKTKSTERLNKKSNKESQVLNIHMEEKQSSGVHKFKLSCSTPYHLVNCTATPNVHQKFSKSTVCYIALYLDKERYLIGFPGINTLFIEDRFEEIDPYNS